jgi:hypothetical protein
MALPFRFPGIEYKPPSADLGAAQTGGGKGRGEVIGRDVIPPEAEIQIISDLSIIVGTPFTGGQSS